MTEYVWCRVDRISEFDSGVINYLVRVLSLYCTDTHFTLYFITIDLNPNVKMHLLGHNLPDHKLLKVSLVISLISSSSCPMIDKTQHSNPFLPRIIFPLSQLTSQVALTSFYGLSHSTTPRLLARLQIPAGLKVQDLTESQITSLSAFLSSPATTPSPPATPLQSESQSKEKDGKGKEREVDPLDGLRIETDLKRDTQGDIAHLRQVGAYRGRR